MPVARALDNGQNGNLEILRSDPGQPVTNGKLHCTKSLNTSYELAMRQRKDATGASSKTHEAWRKWIPPPSWERNDVRATKKRAAYYVVFKSDCAGLFYKWTDCKFELKCNPGASVQGFDTLREAEIAQRKHEYGCARLVSPGGPPILSLFNNTEMVFRIYCDY